MTPRCAPTLDEKPQTKQEARSGRPQTQARPLPLRTPTRHGQPCPAERTTTLPQQGANHRCHSTRQQCQRVQRKKARYSTRQNTQDDGTRSRHTSRQSAARQQQRTGPHPQSQQAATYKLSFLTNTQQTPTRRRAAYSLSSTCCPNGDGRLNKRSRRSSADGSLSMIRMNSSNSSALISTITGDITANAAASAASLLLTLSPSTKPSTITSYNHALPATTLP